jgi:uracil-DNA glycosylase family 4
VTDDERNAALHAIAAEVAACKRCRLHEGRTKSVPGEGSAATEVIFVGEGPGFNEDRQGRPFVGQAGALLDELLGSVGWSRDEVFITNVVKCRPPGNRDPEPDEIATCAPYLARQLEALEPALVVTLGRFSMARFRPGARISGIHGTFAAAALHQGTLRDALFDDMAGVPAALVEARRQREMRTARVLGADAAAEAGAEAGATDEGRVASSNAAGDAADRTEASGEAKVEEPPPLAPPPEGSRGDGVGPEHDQPPGDQPPGDSNQTSQLSLF